MDFRDSPQEAAFRAEARAFLEKHAPSERWDYYAEDLDDERMLRLSKAWQRTLFDNGWGAITWPADFGGKGLGPIEQIVWNQELSRVGLGESIFVVGIGMTGPTIMGHGNDEQRARYLAPMLSGDEVWCQLFSEPGAGSDLAGISTRAVRDGDSWIVNGQKVWCSGGHFADFGILLARTNPDVPKHKGITYFLIDMKTPGIEVRPLRQMTGSSHFTEVFLNDVRIPDSARLGPEGGGWAAAMTTLMNERMAMGGIERMFKFETLAEHARANGARLDPVLRDDLARLYTWAKTLELLNARVITKMGAGMDPTSEASVMKLGIARVVTKAADLGLRLSGPDAVLRQGHWVNQFLFAPALHIAGGTDEIQKNVVAETVLGLPREDRIDKNLAFKDLARGGVG